MLLALTGGGVRPVRAQMLHLDPLPWFTPADSTSRQAFLVEVDRFEEPKFDWNANRLLLTAVLPAGQDGAFFLRMPHVTFDTGQISVRRRWPWMVGDEIEELAPVGSRISSFGQLEVGSLGSLRFPWLGRFRYGAALGIPIGTDRLYPLSSISLPLRLELQRVWTMRRNLLVALTAGSLMNMDSAAGRWSSDAFPGGRHAGAAVTWLRGRNSRVVLALDHEDREGRLSQRATLEGWIPWTAHGSLGCRAVRELAGTLDRYAAWQFSLCWRFDDPRYRPTPPEPAP